MFPLKWSELRVSLVSVCSSRRVGWAARSTTLPFFGTAHDARESNCEPSVAQAEVNDGRTTLQAAVFCAGSAPKVSVEVSVSSRWPKCRCLDLPPTGAT